MSYLGAARTGQGSAGNPRPQDQSPFQLLAAEAAQKACTPPPTFRSGAIPGDTSEADRKQLVSPLVDHLERVLRANNLGRLLDGPNTLRPFTVAFARAPGGTLTQQCLQVTALTDEVARVFSTGLKSFTATALNITLLFRAVDHPGHEEWRALLVGYDARLSVGPNLLRGLRDQFGWSVTHVTRVRSKWDRRLPTNMVTVFIAGTPPASRAEAPSSFRIGNLNIAVRYPGVPHLRGAAPSAPAASRPTPSAEGGLPAPAAPAEVAAPALEQPAVPAPARPLSAPPLGERSEALIEGPSTPAPLPATCAVEPAPTTTTGAVTPRALALGAPRQPPPLGPLSLAFRSVPHTAEAPAPTARPVVNNLTPLGSSPPPRAVSAPSRAELSVVEPPSSKHAADFSDEEGEGRHRRARVHTPSREDDTMDLSDSSAPTEAGSPPPHWTEPSDEDSLGDSARTAPSPGPPAPAGAAPLGAPAPDVMSDD